MTKTKEEIEQKCHQIIDLLSDCDVAEKYVVLKRLCEGFIDVCKEEGINIKEFKFGKNEDRII